MIAYRNMNEALGMVETRGLVGAIEQRCNGKDRMCGRARNTAQWIRGSFGNGRRRLREAATEAGSIEPAVGELITVHVIPRPYDETKNSSTLVWPFH